LVGDPESSLRQISGGKPIGCRGVGRDFTERKEIERKIKQLLGSFGKVLR